MKPIVSKVPPTSMDGVPFLFSSESAAKKQQIQYLAPLFGFELFFWQLDCPQKHFEYEIWEVVAEDNEWLYLRKPLWFQRFAWRMLPKNYLWGFSKIEPESSSHPDYSQWVAFITSFLLGASAKMLIWDMPTYARVSIVLLLIALLYVFEFKRI